MGCTSLTGATIDQLPPPSFAFGVPLPVYTRKPKSPFWSENYGYQTILALCPGVQKAVKHVTSDVTRMHNHLCRYVTPHKHPCGDCVRYDFCCEIPGVVVHIFGLFGYDLGQNSHRKLSSPTSFPLRRRHRCAGHGSSRSTRGDRRCGAQTTNPPPPPSPLESRTGPCGSPGTPRPPRACRPA